MRPGSALALAITLVALTACLPGPSPTSSIIAGESIGSLISIGMTENDLSDRGYERRRDHTNPAAREYVLETGRGLVVALVCADTGRVFLAGIGGALTQYRTPEGFGLRSRAPELIAFYANAPEWQIEIVKKRSGQSVTVSPADQPERRYHFELSLPRDANRVESLAVAIDPHVGCPMAVP